MKNYKINFFCFVLIFAFVIGCSSDDEPENENEQQAGTITDIDGNIYNTVTIGTQVWMVENLKTTKYRNGDPIPEVADKAQWSKQRAEAALCNYQNIPDSGKKYGKLYNWYAVNDNRKLAPVGWHIPTLWEWYTLTNYVESFRGTSNSAAIALAAQTDWNTSSGIRFIGYDLTKNNFSGFSALPAGFRNRDGIFAGIHSTAHWWAFEEVDGGATTVRTYGLSCDGQINLSHSGRYKSEGASVRCVKD